MSIKDALRSIPAKPGLVIGCCLAIGIVGWQGITTYQSCTHRAALTAQLKGGLAAAAAGNPPEFRLADAVPFEWDEVRIMEEVRPDTKPQDCPFGWHWSAAEQAELVDTGRLTVLGFFDGGGFIDFIEYRGDWARFDIDTAPLLRTQAVFTVEPPPTGEGPITLRPLPR